MKGLTIDDTDNWGDLVCHKRAVVLLITHNFHFLLSKEYIVYGDYCTVVNKNSAIWREDLGIMPKGLYFEESNPEGGGGEEEKNFPKNILIFNL